MKITVMSDGLPLMKNEQHNLRLGVRDMRSHPNRHDLATVIIFVGLTISLFSGCSTKPGGVGFPDGPEMEYVTVVDQQGNRREFSRLIMGTDHLAEANWNAVGQPQMSDEQLNALLDEAVRLGINVFDTSPIYVGGIERKLGTWMADRKDKIIPDGVYADPRLNPDRRLYAVSKGGFPFDLFYFKHLPAGRNSPELLTQLQQEGILDASGPVSTNPVTMTKVPPGTYASLLFGDKEQISKRVSEEIRHTVSNLGAGNITVYLMHRDDGDFVRFKRVPREQIPVRVIMEALGDESIAGRYAMIGWSNWETERVTESIRLAAGRLLPKPVLNSPYFSLFEMSDRAIHAGGIQVTHKDMMNSSFQNGIKLMTYSPLGGFSILDKPEPKWDSALKAAKAKFDAGDPYWQNVFHAIFTDANRQRFERVVQFTERFNKQHSTTYTVDQMINAYALAHTRTDFLTVGPITVEQLRRTVGSLKLSRELTAADLDYLYGGRGDPHNK